MEDYYEILGINKNASADEIKKAYHKLIKKYHPDLNPGDKVAEEKSRKINQAYDVLSDPDKKAKYDMYGEAGINGGNPNEGNPFGGFEDLFKNRGFGGFDDLFGRNKSGPTKGQDIAVKAAVSIKAAFTGTKITIGYSRIISCPSCNGKGYTKSGGKVTCPECKGQGQVRRVVKTVFGQQITITPCTKCNGTGSIINDPCDKCNGQGVINSYEKISVDVPAGTLFGDQIRIPGKGCVSTNGGPAGDLYVVIELDNSGEYIADPQGSPNLIHLINIDYTQAILGDNINIKSVDDSHEISIKIKPGTKNDDKLNIYGEGMPSNRYGKGDLIIVFNVRIPTTISSEEERLLKKIQKLHKKK